MSRTRYTFFINADFRAAVAAIKERNGIPESESIRRAIRMWVQAKAPTVQRTTRATKGKGKRS